MDKQINELNGKIFKLKNKLRKLDYYTNKWVEGELSEERWSEIKSQRKAWREEINKLEEQLKIFRQSAEK